MSDSHNFIDHSSNIFAGKHKLLLLKYGLKGFSSTETLNRTEANNTIIYDKITKYIFEKKASTLMLLSAIREPSSFERRIINLNKL